MSRLAAAVIASLALLTACAVETQMSVNGQRLPAAVAADIMRSQINEALQMDPKLAHWDRRPRVLLVGVPLYSSEVSSYGMQGTVKVLTEFDEQGLPAETKVLASPNARLTQMVVDAMNKWRIEPPMKDGKPARFSIARDFSFK